MNYPTHFFANLVKIRQKGEENKTCLENQKELCGIFSPKFSTKISPQKRVILAFQIIKNYAETNKLIDKVDILQEAFSQPNKNLEKTKLQKKFV